MMPTFQNTRSTSRGYGKIRTEPGDEKYYIPVILLRGLLTAKMPSVYSVPRFVAESFKSSIAWTWFSSAGEAGLSMISRPVDGLQREWKQQASLYRIDGRLFESKLKRRIARAE